MRALVVALEIYGGEGGIQRFNRRMIRALVDLGWDVTALALWDKPDDAQRAPAGIRHLAGSRRKWLTTLQFAWLKLTQRQDVVILGHALLAPLLLLGRLTGWRTRQLLIAHGAEVWAPPPTTRGWMVRHCTDAIAAVSHYTASRLQSAYRLDGRNLRVLANAVDGNLADAARTNAEGTHRLLSVARLDQASQDKNIAVLIEAMPLVLKSFADARCTIVGDGDLRPRLEALARERGVEHCVKFLGALGDEARDALYASSDLFVLPSTREGFGIVFLEAWMHRLPVITSDQGAAPEVVQHGVNGLCVVPTAERVAQAIIELLGDPARRREMGESGHSRTQTKFSHAQFRDTLGALLKEMRP